MILYDTDTCIEILRGNKLVMQMHMASMSTIAISFMTVGELYYGAFRSKYRIQNLNRVDEFIRIANVIHSDHEIMSKFGSLKANLVNTGRILPDADILIASTAISKCQKLITGNVDHFLRFEELEVESWKR